MFRDMLSGSQAILAGLVFFLLVVGGSLLYSWHVRRTTDAEVTETQRKVQPLENKNETRITQDTVATSTVDTEQAETPLEVDDLQVSEDTDVLPIDEASEFADVADAFLPDDFVSEEETTEDVPVSPYGFGPYPELPEGWSPSIWPRSSPEHELMMRVQIKLAAQGTRVLGATMDNGLVYPTIKDTVYIEWDEEAGQRYISHLSGDPEACKRLNVIEEARQEEGGFTKEDIPLDIEIVPFKDGGIDPYQFLELPRR